MACQLSSLQLSKGHQIFFFSPRCEERQLCFTGRIWDSQAAAFPRCFILRTPQNNHGRCDVTSSAEAAQHRVSQLACEKSQKQVGKDLLSPTFDRPSNLGTQTPPGMATPPSPWAVLVLNQLFCDETSEQTYFHLEF